MIIKLNRVYCLGDWFSETGGNNFVELFKSAYMTGDRQGVTNH